MNRKNLRKWMFGGALVLALAGAALSAATPSASSQPLSQAPGQLAPFDLAALLSQSPPDVVIIGLDDTKPNMLGSLPASAFGPNDETLIRAAPKARRIILVGRDPVRVDRVARQLLASGRQVEVLEGGVDAWNGAMQQDPKAPEANAPLEDWDQYKQNVALRRYFGEASSPPSEVRAPAPVMAAPKAAKKREGC